MGWLTCPCQNKGRWEGEATNHQDIWYQCRSEKVTLCLCQRSVYHSSLCGDRKPRSSCYLLHQWNHWPSQNGRTFPCKPGHQGQDGCWVRRPLSLYRQLHDQTLRLFFFFFLNQTQFSWDWLQPGTSEKTVGKGGKREHMSAYWVFSDLQCDIFIFDNVKSGNLFRALSCMPTSFNDSHKIYMQFHPILIHIFLVLWGAGNLLSRYPHSTRALLSAENYFSNSLKWEL